jgi:hypothetical protein
LALRHKLPSYVANSIFCNYLLRQIAISDKFHSLFQFLVWPWRFLRTGSSLCPFWTLSGSCKSNFSVFWLKDPTIVDDIVILFVFQSRFTNFDSACFYSLFVIIPVNIVAPWADVCLLPCHNFFIGAKRLVKPRLSIQTGSNGCVLMTFYSFMIRVLCYGFELLKYLLAALISGAQQALAIIGVLKI